VKFALRMAWRELRASWKQLALFFVCIGVGTGSIVTLRSFIGSVDSYIAREARTINGGDILIQTDRPLTEGARETIDRVGLEQGVLERTEIVGTVTMLRPLAGDASSAKLAELEAVEPQYPLYGEFLVAGGVPYSYDLLRGAGALVSTSLAAQLGIQTGDRVRIGSGDFEVRGLIERQPGGLNAFSFGRRVLISTEDLKTAGLLDFGSRSRRKILLRVAPEAQDAVLGQFKRDLKGELVLVRGYSDAQQGLSDQLAKSADYLSLAGLAILLLGGVGIWSVTRVFVAQRVKAVAVLKCLGCTSRQVVTTYTAQSVALGTLGSLLGVLFAAVSLLALQRTFADGPLAQIQLGLQPAAIAQGVAMGMLVSLLFSLVPLLSIRAIKVSLVMRSVGGTPARRWDALTVLAAIGAVLGLGAAAAWQAGSLRVGVLFLGGSLLTGIALALLAEGLIRGLKAVRRLNSFALRYAISGLHRPGNQTRAVVITIGLGVFFLSGAYSVQSALLGALDAQLDANLPDMYLVDVQEDQREDVARIVREATGEAPVLIPTIRARIVELNGRPVDLDAAKSDTDRARLGREYTVTSRAGLEENEEAIAGSWWASDASDVPEISIEESLSTSYGLDVGETMSLDLLGEVVTARISSVRRVDWENSRVGFMIVFRPGTLERLPLTYIGAIRGPSDPAGRGYLARQLSDAHPNVSIIDALDIIRTVRRVLSAINLAVTIVGVFVLVTGLTILAGSIAVTRYLRLYESAVLKALGATTRTVLKIAAVEFSLLGMLAGAVGSVLAIGLAWAVCRYVLDLPWHYEPAVTVVGTCAAAAVVALIGSISSANAALRKPLPVLRSE
jgi:putative ABC transport system permease protein